MKNVTVEDFPPQKEFQEMVLEEDPDMNKVRAFYDANKKDIKMSEISVHLVDGKGGALEYQNVLLQIIEDGNLEVAKFLLENGLGINADNHDDIAQLLDIAVEQQADEDLCKALIGAIKKLDNKQSNMRGYLRSQYFRENLKDKENTPMYKVVKAKLEELGNISGKQGDDATPKDAQQPARIAVPKAIVQVCEEYSFDRKFKMKINYFFIREGKGIAIENRDELFVILRAAHLSKEEADFCKRVMAACGDAIAAAEGNEKLQGFLLEELETFLQDDQFPGDSEMKKAATEKVEALKGKKDDKPAPARIADAMNQGEHGQQGEDIKNDPKAGTAHASDNTNPIIKFAAKVWKAICDVFKSIGKALGIC